MLYAEHAGCHWCGGSSPVSSKGRQCFCVCVWGGGGEGRLGAWTLPSAHVPNPAIDCVKTASKGSPLRKSTTPAPHLQVTSLLLRRRRWRVQLEPAGLWRSAQPQLPCARRRGTHSFRSSLSLSLSLSLVYQLSESASCSCLPFQSLLLGARLYFQPPAPSTVP